MKCKICGYNNKKDSRICQYCGCYLHFPDTYIHIIIAITLFLIGHFVSHSIEIFIKLLLFPYGIYIAIIGVSDVIKGAKIRKKNNINLKDLREKAIQRIEADIEIEDFQENNSTEFLSDEQNTDEIYKTDKIKIISATENSTVLLFVIACVLLGPSVSFSLMMSPSTIGNLIGAILFALFLLNLFCLFGRERLKNLRHVAVIADALLFLIIVLYFFGI